MSTLIKTLSYNSNDNVFDVGNEKWWRGETAPLGWLIEQGQLVLRKDYQRLYKWAYENNFIVDDEDWQTNKKYGYFSSGDNSTTFRIPDLRKVFIRGFDPDITSSLGTQQNQGLPNIYGAFWLGDGAFFGGCNGAFYQLSGTCYEDPNRANVGSGAVHFSAEKLNPIYGASNNVTPVNIAFNRIIKY